MKVKSLILTLCFVLFAMSSYAQSDKYEYGELIYAPYNGHYKKVIVTINLNGKVSQSEVIKIEGGISVNATPAFKELEDLSDKGWEVYSTDIIAGVTTTLMSRIYHLRKKKE